MAKAQLVVWSDYLCPWCFNAAVRLERVQQEFGDRLEIEWRTYLLRPHPRGGPAGFPAEGEEPPQRSSGALEKFRAYTQSWMRPAGEADGGVFQVWEGEAGPPSHSVPPHVAAKAAASLGPEAFAALHRRLLEAYFSENRDVTARSTLLELWLEAGLPREEFERCDDPALVAETLRQHQEALELGVTGVPCAQMKGNDALIVGANPLELYQRWVTRTLEAQQAS